MDLFRTLFVSLFASAVMAVDCTPSIYIASVPFNDPMPFTGRLTSTGPGCPHNNATYTLSNGGAIMSVGFSQLYSVVIGAQIFEPSTYCSFSVKLKYPQGCSSDSLFLAVIPRGSTDLDKGVGASYEMRIKVGSRYTKTTFGDVTFGWKPYEYNDTLVSKDFGTAWSSPESRTITIDSLLQVQRNGEGVATWDSIDLRVRK